MIKKLKYIVLIAFILLLCGCEEASITVKNPLTEDEIIEYVQKQVYNETSDETEVSIINKEDLLICGFWLDDCWSYDAVEGGYEYELEIVSKENPEIIGKGTYKDGYVKKDDDGQETSEEPYYYSNYKDQKEIYLKNQNED